MDHKKNIVLGVFAAVLGGGATALGMYLIAVKPLQKQLEEEKTRIRQVPLYWRLQSYKYPKEL